MKAVHTPSGVVHEPHDPGLEWHAGQHIISIRMFEAGANGKGAAACLIPKHKALMRSKSRPMMRRLFNAFGRPMVSYWYKACPGVWLAREHSLALGPELKDMLGVQMTF